MKSLYVTDRAAIGDERFLELLDRLRGAPALTVELREREGCDRERLAWAKTARERLGDSVPLLVNQRFDVALAAQAQGVHLPASGLPLSRVRSRTPRGFRIGVSTHSAGEAREAIERSAEVVVVGPIFETPEKHAFGPPLGVEALGSLPAISEHSSDVFAIGGIGMQQIEQLEPYRDRISGIAGIRLFQQASDPRAVAEEIALS